MPVTKDTCFLFHPMSRNGGQTITVRRWAAIGDSLAASVVADKLAAQGYRVVWQTHGMIHCVLRRQPNIAVVEEAHGRCDVNLDGAYENDPKRRERAFWEMFVERSNTQLAKLGINLGPPTNCKPKILVPDSARDLVRKHFAPHPRPWTFVCPKSNSYTVRQVPGHIWQAAASMTDGTKFWIGTDPAPAGYVDLKSAHLDHLIEWLAVADLLVTVDTGPMHLAAALNIPIVAILQSSAPELHLNDQNDFLTIAPGLDCLNCQLNLCPKNRYIPPCTAIDPKLIADAANAKLHGSGKVSCVIPIFRPPAERLNKCLAAIIQQVYEVVVTVDIAGAIPQGALQDPKIRYVQRPNRGRNSFGANVNFGVRHTNGEFLFFLNDDCYVNGDVVSKCLEVMKPDVGIVGHFLRYGPRSPRAGRICHGGKYRHPGMRGWGLFDWGKYHATIKEPMEMECVTGTSILVRRKAHFDVNGFDEDVAFYTEDDLLCMQMRKAGWKIMYQPHAHGQHDEAQSTGSHIQAYMNESHQIFWKKYGEYFEHNRNRIPGNFDFMP